MSLAKRLAARLPARMQSELKRLQYARQIRRGTLRLRRPSVLATHDVLVAPHLQRIWQAAIYTYHPRTLGAE